MTVVRNRSLTHPIDDVPGNSQFGQFGRNAQPTVQVVQSVRERRPFKSCQALEVADLLGRGFKFHVPPKDGRHQDCIESSMMKLRLLDAA